MRKRAFPRSDARAGSTRNNATMVDCKSARPRRRKFAEPRGIIDKLDAHRPTAAAAATPSLGGVQTDAQELSSRAEFKS
jgi:hypothetical protein